MEILRIEDLSFFYPECKIAALDKISFSVSEGEFITLAGATGSGKSTLLRLIKKELAPMGKAVGKISVCGKENQLMSTEESARTIGFVMQNTDEATVTDKVFSELAFGLENLGERRSVIERRVAEMSSYFGIDHLFDKPTSELSGGQRQLLALASVMTLDPKLIILDEPTAMLDPIAATEFITTLKKLNRDFATTVIIAEHRLEELIPISDRVITVEGGRIKANGTPRDVLSLIDREDRLYPSMPTAARLYRESGSIGECPLDVSEGKRYLECNFSNIKDVPRWEKYNIVGETALEFINCSFRYGKDLPDVTDGLDLKIYKGEIFAILGGNGSGKSTALSLAAGLKRPYIGKVKVFGKTPHEYKSGSLYRECLSMLPQDPEALFFKDTVFEDLSEIGDPSSLPFDISHLYEKHPFDLSGGERQLCALAKVLLSKPRILLLDEPTKGLDGEWKEKILSILRSLKDSGMTIVLVTHDVEFAALAADRCTLFFRGRALSTDTVDRFFTDNKFYTTAVARIARSVAPGAVTLSSLLSLIGGAR